VWEPRCVEPAAGWEQRLGARAFIWVGAVTLALAAIFLVRYSIEEGWLSPDVRVILAALFGFALIGGAEKVRPRDDRVAQAMAAAGVAAIYGALFAAVSLYDMVSKAGAGGAAAALTAFAIGVSLRHGILVAALAFVGGFVSPAIIGSETPNTPVLFGLPVRDRGRTLWVIRHRGWWLLGWGVLAGSAVWTLLWMVADASGLIWVACSSSRSPGCSCGRHGAACPKARIRRTTWWLSSGSRWRRQASCWPPWSFVTVASRRWAGWRWRARPRSLCAGALDAALPVRRGAAAGLVAGNARAVVARRPCRRARRAHHRVRRGLCARRLRADVERGAAGLLGGAVGRGSPHPLPVLLVGTAHRRDRHAVGPDQHRPRRPLPGRAPSGWRTGARA
jgi:hypothetical protein